MTTVYLVDVSDSAKFYKEEAQKFISDAIKEMPSNESAGVVTFGADTKLEQFVTDKKVFDKLSAMPNQTATNIEEGVSTAMALFGADQAKRIVLITDGYEDVYKRQRPGRRNRKRVRKRQWNRERVRKRQWNRRRRHGRHRVEHGKQKWF